MIGRVSRGICLRFVDASVFVHGIINPTRSLSEKEIKMKENAAKIIQRINTGEKVGITTVQISEIANILESHSPEKASLVKEFLIKAPSVKIYTVNRAMLKEAHSLSLEYTPNRIGLNDSVAYVIMINHGYNEIYSFDKDFDTLKNIKRIDM
jgi:predicted nucleic acid-binding protein